MHVYRPGFMSIVVSKAQLKKSWGGQNRKRIFHYGWKGYFDTCNKEKSLVLVWSEVSRLKYLSLRRSTWEVCGFSPPPETSVWYIQVSNQEWVATRPVTGSPATKVGYKENRHQHKELTIRQIGYEINKVCVCHPYYNSEGIVSKTILKSVPHLLPPEKTQRV